MKRDVINVMLGLFVAMAFGIAGCGGGGGDTSATIAPTGTNATPVANAGAAQSVVTGAVVTLDGSTSSDANGDLLSYTWSYTSKPAGSNAALSSATVAKPTFTADVAGTYVMNLVVNDGKVNSAAVTVTITAAVANAAPVANAGIAQSVITGAIVTLDGSASSDANSDLLTYSWAFTSKPSGSNAALSSSTVAKPTFTADVAGAYVLNLVVNDGKVNSTSSAVTVAVTTAQILFNTLYDSLKSTFTKSMFETTDTFNARVSAELIAQKSYTTISTSSTYNQVNTTYDADLQKAKITFFTGCRSGDNGEACSPQNGIVMHEVRSPSTSNSSYTAYHFLSIANAPSNFSAGLEVSISPTDAADLVNNNPRVVVDFTLDSTVPVSLNMIDTILPTSNYRIRSYSGWTYSYSYSSINAIVSKISFISRTSGKTLATYIF